MSKPNNDISSLFKHLGTSSEHYQEIGRSNEARESEARWPLLASIHELATATPGAIPAVAPALSPARRNEGLVKTATPVEAAVTVQPPSRQEPSIGLPAHLREAPDALQAAAIHAPATLRGSEERQRAPAHTSTAGAPAHKAEFIAPRAKSLVSIGSRNRSPMIVEPTATAVRADPEAVAVAVAASHAAEPVSEAPSSSATASHTDTGPGQIEGLFARLAKPKAAPGLEQPVTPLQPTPVAPEPKRSLFERLIRK